MHFPPGRCTLVLVSRHQLLQGLCHLGYSLFPKLHTISTLLRKPICWVVLLLTTTITLFSPSSSRKKHRHAGFLLGSMWSWSQVSIDSVIVFGLWALESFTGFHWSAEEVAKKEKILQYTKTASIIIVNDTTN
jgi:hypothetical protein